MTWMSAMLVAAGIAAQSLPSQQRMASQLRRNQEELRNYTWTSTYTYEVDGAQRRQDVYTVRYAFDGSLGKTQISSKIDKKKIRRPDGKKLKKKEREAAYDFGMSVKSQLDGYLNPMFSEKAVSTATITTSDDTLILRSEDVVTKGDTVEIRYSLQSHLPRSATIKTTVDDSPVSLDVEFASLEYGPNYTARSTTTAVWQGLQLVIRTENSDIKSVGR